MRCNLPDNCLGGNVNSTNFNYILRQWINMKVNLATNKYKLGESTKKPEYKTCQRLLFSFGEY